MESYQLKFMNKFAIILVIITLCTILVAPSSYLLAIIAAVITLFSAEIKQNLIATFNYKTQYFTLLLLAILAIGITYNNFDIHAAYHEFFKYGYKLLLLLLLPPLFTVKKWRNHALNSMTITAFILTIVLMFYQHQIAIIPFMSIKKFFAIRSAIPWSLYLSFSCFLLLNKLIDNTRGLIGYLPIVALAFISYYLFFINIERTGMLVFFALIYLVMIQRLHKKWLTYATILLLITIPLLFYFSASVHTRTIEVKQNIIQYRHGNPHTSIGLRLDFFKHSLRLIKQRPLFGFGTGSFPFAYHTTYGATLKKGELLGDPHNSYFHLAVQTGLVGLTIFICWLIMQIIDTKKLPKPERYYAQGIILLFILTSFFISGFLRQKVALFYVLTLSILFGAGIE